jgi:hypothetical protein
MQNTGNFLPACQEYANYLALASTKLNKSIDECRSICGLLTVNQLNELLKNKEDEN